MLFHKARFSVPYFIFSILMRKLKDLEFKKQYQFEITNTFAALGSIRDGGDINRAWENIKEYIKT